MDFSKYKGRLVEYLHAKGFEGIPGLIKCINPAHDDQDPSCQVFDDNFICYGGSCGEHGDIYDAIRLLEGITDKKEQYLFAERFFDGGPSPRPAPPKEEKEKPKFKPDPDALAAVISYMKKNPAADKMVKQFLSIRARHKTKGRLQSYPPEIINNLAAYFYYWPGLDIARNDGLDIKTMIAAGVPQVHPKKGFSTWDSSGAVMELGSGLKLHYYKDGICEKRNTNGGTAFPMPGKIDLEKPVVLVEGEMDALACRAAGIENIFSTGGTNGLTGPKVKEYLLNAKEIIFLFDADDAGRKASGLIPFEATDKEATNRPEIALRAGYAGIIKVASLPPQEETGCKDQDDLIINDKAAIIKKAIAESKEYVPPKINPENKQGAKWDFLTLKRIQSLLKKLPRADLASTVGVEPEDIQAFISAVYQSIKNKKDVEKELIKWGAKKEEIQNKNEYTPYNMLEILYVCGITKYIQKAVEIELTPASELLKKLKWHEPIVKMDFENLNENENLKQFIKTKGVRSAALFISNILDGRMIFEAAEEEFFFFNGHTWQHESDMTGVVFNIFSATFYYFLQNGICKKTVAEEIIDKIESRHFRMDITKEFSQLKEDGVWQKYVNFDGPAIEETLTLIDGVMDFSGPQIVYRAAKREEYRRDVLPYKIEQVKNGGNPKLFYEFMRGNFKNEDTLQSLMYFLSLIASRNTQYKVAGFFIGRTNTGKTTTVSVMEAVYPNMLQNLPASVLVGKGERHLNSGGANPYLAQMEGKGAAILDETERNTYLNTGLFKEITGGGTIITRDLYKSAHPFKMTAQIIMTTNDPPRFDSHDSATIGRMIIIPFMIEHKREKEKVVLIEEFIEKLSPDFPSVVRVLAEYYIKLKYEKNKTIPLSIECLRYKKNYVEDQDTDLDKFVKDCIIFTITKIDTEKEKEHESEAVFVPVKDVWHRYLKYFGYVDADGNPDEKNKEALTQNKFTRYLKRDYMAWGLNYKQKKIKGYPVLCFFNIELAPDDGKEHETTPPDLQPAEPPQREEPDYMNPPEENPFGD